MEDLPVELHLHILNYIDTDMIVKFCTCNKYLHKILISPILWKLLLLRDYSYYVRSEDAYMQYRRYTVMRNDPLVSNALVSELISNLINRNLSSTKPLTYIVEMYGWSYYIPITVTNGKLSFRHNGTEQASILGTNVVMHDDILVEGVNQHTTLILLLLQLVSKKDMLRILERNHPQLSKEGTITMQQYNDKLFCIIFTDTTVEELHIDDGKLFVTNVIYNKYKTHIDNIVNALVNITLTIE